MQNRLSTMLLAAAVLAAAPLAAAQPVGRPYLGVHVGAHHEGADRVTGTTAAVRVVAGVRLKPALGLERSTLPALARSYRAIYRHQCLVRGSGASREEIQRLGVVTRFIKARQVLATVSAGIACYICQPQGRWRPRLFLGATNHRASGSGASGSPSRSRKASIRERVRRTLVDEAPLVRNLGGLTVGGSVGFAVTPRPGDCARRPLRLRLDRRRDQQRAADLIAGALVVLEDIASATRVSGL